MLLADIFILLTEKMQNNFLIGANLKPQRLLAQQLSYYLLNKDWQQKVLLKTIRGGGGGMRLSFQGTLVLSAFI